MRTLAHLSDLHFGHSAKRSIAARRIVHDLLVHDVAHVVVTGDLTNRGRHDEYAAFEGVFAPLLERGRVTIVPGNHDRPSDDVAALMMGNRRVDVDVHPGLYLVKLDSTGAHNRLLWQGHGLVTAEDLEALDAALDDAPRDALVVVLMHHHPYRLPEEGALERLSRFAGLPYAAELHSGADLLEVVSGRADLLLHGHRHVPSELRLDRHDRPLTIYNAGSSTELGRYRILEHQRGRVHGGRWQSFVHAPVAPSWIGRMLPATAW